MMPRGPQLLAIALVACGCAVSGTSEYGTYRERAVTETQGGLGVTVALPTAAEAADIYGVDLAEKGIQPVWVEVRNDTVLPYWLLFSGLDPNYFAASEAAHAFGATPDPRFDRLQFRNPIPPGATVSGFVLTNLDEGFKVVDVDLIARGDARNFTFVAADPSFKATSLRVNFDELYPSDELIYVDDENALRLLLERLPCCVTNADGTKNGDPLNLVLVGDRVDLQAAFVRRQWHATEILWSGSLWRTVRSFVLGSRYRYSPFSSLYLYGRSQDLAAQKARGSIDERNHARFWLSPIRFRGKEVYVGQVSRDIGVKFTLKSPTLSTHVIDPYVDEARQNLVEDLLYSLAVHRIGFVKGVGPSSKAEPQRNLMGDPYYSDGLRAVMFFEPRPSSLRQLEFLHWERAGDPQRRAPYADAPLRARVLTKSDGGIRVSAAVPSASESRALFGVDLEEHGIQPLWLEIENESERPFYFLLTGLDPEYFPPNEVAFLFEDESAVLAEHLEALSLDSRRAIAPAQTISGFVYANRAQPSMMVTVDLIWHGWSDRIGLVVPMPGTETAQQRMAELSRLQAESDVVEIDDEPALRSALEKLPCCAEDPSGARLPLNLVLIGELDEWAPAFVRRGYRYLPASPLQVFGRVQDLTGRRISRWVAPQPHTLRLWLTVLRFHGKPIWVGQVSTTLGGRFAASDGDTLRIEPDVDAARYDVLQDLSYSESLAKIGFVQGAGPTADGSSNPTDGLRTVLVFGGNAVSLGEIDFFDWERLVDSQPRADGGSAVPPKDR